MDWSDDPDLEASAADLGRWLDAVAAPLLARSRSPRGTQEKIEADPSSSNAADAGVAVRAPTAAQAAREAAATSPRSRPAVVPAHDASNTPPIGPSSSIPAAVAPTPDAQADRVAAQSPSSNADVTRSSDSPFGFGVRAGASLPASGQRGAEGLSAAGTSGRNRRTAGQGRAATVLASGAPAPSPALVEAALLPMFDGGGPTVPGDPAHQSHRPARGADTTAGDPATRPGRAASPTTGHTAIGTVAPSVATMGELEDDDIAELADRLATHLETSAIDLGIFGVEP